MNRVTGALAVFAIISVGSLAYMIAGTSDISYSQIPFEPSHTVELKESLAITDNINAELLHPLIGTIQFSEDLSECWEVTEKMGAFYYKILEECPINA